MRKGKADMAESDKPGWVVACFHCVAVSCIGLILNDMAYPALFGYWPIVIFSYAMMAFGIVGASHALYRIFKK